MMLYSVRLQWCLKIEATSEVEAYRKVCSRIKEEPGIVISSVYAGDWEDRKRPLWQKLLFGYKAR